MTPMLLKQREMPQVSPPQQLCAPHPRHSRSFKGIGPGSLTQADIGTPDSPALPLPASLREARAQLGPWMATTGTPPHTPNTLTTYP